MCRSVRDRQQGGGRFRQRRHGGKNHRPAGDHGPGRAGHPCGGHRWRHHVHGTRPQCGRSPGLARRLAFRRSRHTTGNDGRAVPAMSGLRDQCCNRAKIRGRVADALPAFNLSPCPACLSLRPPDRSPSSRLGPAVTKRGLSFPLPALWSAHVPWPAPAIPPFPP